MTEIRPSGALAIRSGKSIFVGRRHSSYAPVRLCFFTDLIRPGAKYSRLFPFYTRIYFDGCGVGRGNAGTEFLGAVGNILLSMGGGETFALEDDGAPIPGSWFPIGGHTYHTSEVKRLYFRPGGVEYFPPPQPDISTLAASIAW
jgi:hypothetical protein